VTNPGPSHISDPRQYSNFIDSSAEVVEDDIVPDGFAKNVFGYESVDVDCRINSIEWGDTMNVSQLT
jgi:hypothetical protein